MSKPSKPPQKPQDPSLFAILGPYKNLIIPLVLVAIVANALTLWLPRLMSHGIDTYFKTGSIDTILWQYSIASLVIFILTYGQSIIQTYASEKVARDMRKNLSDKIASQSFLEIQAHTPGKLLTNLTSDIDAIKNFVAQAVANIVAAVFLIIGTSILLLSINWKLALVVLMVIPIIGGTFSFVLAKVRVLFLEGREVVDRLNKVINESILAAPLIRVLNSQKLEHGKFDNANAEARKVGVSILKFFASMIPIVTFAINLAVLAIVVIGGRFVINNSMSLGDFAAFQSYLVILIFPIFLLGFMSNIIAQAQASYTRIAEILKTPPAVDTGVIEEALSGDIEVEKVTLEYGGRTVLKDIDIKILPKTKTAIIGPTAAGKTQLLNLLIGLIKPTSGHIKYDQKNLEDFKKESLYKQVGLVFQDSIIFNISLRENIAFNTEVSEADINRAIQTAELKDFLDTLPNGLETVVSERGTSLSGGQKQRIMLARALAINPKILLLDDFTARVDASTEKKILENVSKNYPDLTLVSVTQKVSSVEHYDQIIVLMEGELVASGKHEELLHSSPEYVQIYNSQASTQEYELQSK